MSSGFIALKLDDFAAIFRVIDRMFMKFWKIDEMKFYISALKIQSLLLIMVQTAQTLKEACPKVYLFFYIKQLIF